MLINEDVIDAVGIVPPGSAVQWGKTKSGNEYVRIPIEVTEGPYTGYTKHWDGWLHTDKTTDRTIESLRIMGYQGDDVVDVSAEDLTNAFSMMIERDTDGDSNPTKWHRVVFINRRYRVMPVKNKLDEGAKRLLSARIKARAAEIAKEPLVQYVRPEPAASPAEETAEETATDYTYSADEYVPRSQPYPNAQPAAEDVPF